MLSDELLILLTRQINFDREQKAAAIDCLFSCASRLFVHADLQTAYWTPPAEMHPQHVTAPFVSPSFCFDVVCLGACPLAVHISTAVLCRPSTSFCNALAEPYRTVYPANVILIGSDMCEHPLGSGHSENGSDCCRMFGESRSHTFVMQNVALQNWSSSDFVLIPCSKPARIQTSVLRFKKACFE
jgi:hypothetical protein